MTIRNRAVFPLLVFALVSLPRAAAAGPIFTPEIAQYLAIGTGSAEVGASVNIQKAEWGRISPGFFVSPFDPNLKSIFDQPPDPTKMRWDSVTNTTYPALPDSAPVGEGLDFTGHTAVTSETGRFGISTTNFYSTGFSVRCASELGTASGECLNGLGSPQNSPWFNGSEVPSGDVGAGAGVVGDYNHNLLIANLIQARTDIAAFSAECTMTAANTNFDAVGSTAFNVDNCDLDNDGFAVIDIVFPGTNFEFNMHDLILDGDGSTVGIFRIRGTSNMNVSNSSIALGPGGIGGASATTPPTRLGAIFVSYEEGAGSSDQVFNFNNTIVNGVGFWDLNAFAGGVYNDDVHTVLNMQNSQGCSQFISSQVLQTSDSRFSRCAGSVTEVPEPASLSLLGMGLVGLAALLRRRRT